MMNAVQAKLTDYDGFVEKFKPKLTTDDCYTPPQIYEIIKNWAVERYGLQGRTILRPFKPGGDYEAEEYPEGCVVIDNPPFSILRKIKDFYITHHVDFVLFAPTLTLFSSTDNVVNYIQVNMPIRYHNGAVVNTSLVTNLGDNLVETAPDLRRKIVETQKKSGVKFNTVAKYVYPEHVISSALLNKYVKHVQPFVLKRSEALFVRALDSQRAAKKSIYGGGISLAAKPLKGLSNAYKVR
ncbi:hypothetical protein [Gardnerella sp. KA00127]|jgi:hypothetical protein|uniref:hypothetical protein n=1 Tax=Gardnerella sp. KA00127 TaxID=2749070 RepID=UPI002056B853|nr:MAG TPA: adenine-specific methyltransferase [Caudoviricetes sp.]